MSQVSVYHDGKWLRFVPEAYCQAEVAGRCLSGDRAGNWRTASRRNEGGWDVFYYDPTVDQLNAWENRIRTKKREWMEYAHN